MLSDPLANVTLGGVAQTLPNTERDGGTGKNPTIRAVYRTSDSSLVATVLQKVYRDQGYDRSKSTVTFDQMKTATDLANPALQRQYHASVTVIIDRPATPIFTETEIVNLALCETGFLTASTNAVLKKLYGGES